MTTYRLNHAMVVDGAAELVNTKGVEALSLAELAARFRVRTPSLYNHVDGLEGLRRALALKALTELANTLREATTGLAGRDALAALAHAYRAWAHTNPGLYPFLLRTFEGEESELKQAADDLVRLLVAALRGYNLPEAEQIHGVRTVRALLHGFVSLELAGGFGMPVAVEETWARLIALADKGLRAWSGDGQ